MASADPHAGPATALPSEPAVWVEGLVVAHGSLRAVNGVSLSVGAGEVVALLGPNGAGKTTTVETIEGYHRPSHGSVRVLGLDPVADHAALVRRLGVMPQSSRLYSVITPREALRLFASYHRSAEHTADLLELVGLTDRAKTSWRRLSGGEQQRLSLALALVGTPCVLILDEPTAGLDLDGRELVRSIIADRAAAGVAVLVTTHELDEAERVADRLVIIDRGSVVAAGRLDELTADCPAEIRFGAVPGIDTAALGAALGGSATEVRSGEYVVGAVPSPSNVAALTSWLAEHDVALGELRAGRQRLEDLYRRLLDASRSSHDVTRSEASEQSP